MLCRIAVGVVRVRITPHLTDLHCMDDLSPRFRASEQVVEAFGGRLFTLGRAGSLRA